MELPKFHRVNEIFILLFKIRAYGAFKKLLDIQMIYEQMKCVRHF